VVHGFLTARDGAITTFDAPGAGTVTGMFQGTFGNSINPNGAIEGNYWDADNVSHGFAGARDGAIMTFDAPGAGTGAGQGTIPRSNNEEGTIAGG